MGQEQIPGGPLLEHQSKTNAVHLKQLFVFSDTENTNTYKSHTKLVSLPSVTSNSGLVIRNERTLESTNTICFKLQNQIFTKKITFEKNEVIRSLITLKEKLVKHLMSSIRLKPIQKDKRGKGRKKNSESYNFILLKY